MPTAALLCPPTYFDVIDMKNPYMVGDSPIDKEKARAQWDALCSALQSAGIKVEIIDPVPGLEDMVFAANQIFVGCHAEIGKFVVPSHMRYASRQREVPYFVEWFCKRGYKILDINLGDEYLEGAGDLIWHPDRSRIYAGYKFRTTIGAVRLLTEKMKPLGISVTPLELIDAHCYHLDTSLCPLNNDAVLIYPGAYSQESLAALHTFWKRVHELTREEALGFIGNGIVATGRYLTPRLTPNLERILTAEILQPIVLDTSEFEKSGGSLFCMKTFLD